MKDKKINDNMLIIIAAVVLISLVVGVSYAAFRYSKIGNVENVITTGAITMSYTESEKGINLVDALPMTDVTGKNLNDEGQIFDFTVAATIKGSMSINYAITATIEEDNYLTSNFVKVYLTDVDDKVDSLFGSDAKRVKDLKKADDNNMAGVPSGEFILKEGIYSKNTVENYRLRMWVAEDYVGAGSGNMPKQTYKLKVNVYGNAGALQ